MIDFREVKARVSLASVLARYRVEVKGNGQGRADCVFPSHSGGRGTLSVNHEKNVWKCFGACPGRKGGNVLDFVALMERCTIKESAEKLVEWFLASSNSLTTAPEPKKTEASPERDASRESLTKPVEEKGWIKAQDSWIDQLFVLQPGDTEETWKKRVRREIKTNLIISFANGQKKALAG